MSSPFHLDKVAFLIGLDGSGNPNTWRVNKSEYLIGREAPADLLLQFPQISRQHARIVYRQGGYWLADLGSRNGTFVNGERLGPEPRRLVSGDEIVWAGVTTLRFFDPEETLETTPVGRLQGIWLDESSHQVWVDGKLVIPALPASQYALLALLYQRLGQVVTRDQMGAAIWPDADPAGISEEAIDAVIKRLRGRLRETQPQRDYLETVRGIGLKLLPFASE